MKDKLKIKPRSHLKFAQSCNTNDVTFQDSHARVRELRGEGSYLDIGWGHMSRENQG